MYKLEAMENCIKKMWKMQSPPKPGTVLRAPKPGRRQIFHDMSQTRTKVLWASDKHAYHQQVKHMELKEHLRKYPDTLYSQQRIGTLANIRTSFTHWIIEWRLTKET